MVPLAERPASLRISMPATKVTTLTEP